MLDALEAFPEGSDLSRDEKIALIVTHMASEGDMRAIEFIGRHFLPQKFEVEQSDPEAAERREQARQALDDQIKRLEQQ